MNTVNTVNTAAESPFHQRRIYVASSWRCMLQQAVVPMLRAAGHAVYDFRQPAPGQHGFSWREIDPDWQDWTPERFKAALTHPAAERGFTFDVDAMAWADTCVLVLPCGRSAHLEAGWMRGAGKDFYVLMLEQSEPELLYKLATQVCTTVDELLTCVGVQEPSHG